MLAQVHEELSKDIQVGDYIRLPFIPVVKVIDKIEGKGVITFIVQAGANLPEEWKIEIAVEVEVAAQQPKQKQEVTKQEQEVEIKHLVYTATPYYRQVVNSKKPKTKRDRRRAAILR